MTRCSQQRPPWRALCFLSLALLAASLPAYGPFKQRTADLRWRILKSANFDIYYYPEEEGLAHRTAVIAERALAHDSHVLDYYPRARQPLFLFQNHLEFQQTNISPEVIGPGTGGFTEAYKNRMVLPTTQSDRWLEIVITHELAHAVQFNVLYGEGTRSFQVFKNYVIPLWVMEGMAEYCAQNWDSYADMVLRDGVLNERLPDLELLDGFSHLDEVYLAYKGGQTAIQYLADTYGPESVARLLKKYKAQISTGQIIKDLTGRSAAAFNRAWKASLRQKYWLQAKGKQAASNLGSALTWDDHESLTTNDGAVFSPDGRQVAFITSRTQREEIWVMDADGKDPHVLLSGPFEELGRSGGYGVSGNRLSWSPDGQTLAFVQVRDAQKRLVLADLKRGGTRELETGFREIAAPAFSPDGKQIAFSAAKDGISQLYLMPSAGGPSVALSSESGTSLITDPSWSPDGKQIAFSAEEAGKNQVFRINADGSGRIRLSPPTHDCLMPAFSADGSKVFFSTDDGGGYNLAWVHADGSHYERLSDVVTGVFNPHPSADGRWLLFTAYEDGCQNLYRMAAPGFKQAPPSLALQALINPFRFAAKGLSVTAEPAPAPGSSSASAFTEPQAPPLGAQEPLPPDAESAVQAQPLTETATAELKSEPYRAKVTPDLFFMLLGYDSLNGLVGGGYLTASDMVGDHNLALYANFVPGYQSVVQADYLFLRGENNVGLSLFYRNTNFFLANINPQTVSPTFLDQDAGGQLFLQHPFSKFTRLDLDLGARRLVRQLNGEANLDPAVASTLGDNFINSVGIGLQRDTQTYKNFDVYGGYHIGFNSSYADKVLGGTRNFVLHQLEARGSLPLSFVSKDAVLSARVLGLEQTGEDRQLFYFGGAQVRGMSYNEELGQRFAFGSIQFRQPYLKDLNGALWPFESLLIKDVHAVAFYDVGTITDDWANVTPERVRGGYGGGLRLHAFLFEKAFILFAFDVAQRTDRPGATYYYFTLGQIF
jgi:Tol biopolymer transport system component